MHIIIFFFGALLGSFFYTLSIRYINGSIKENPVKALFSVSRCTDCAARINPLHLIPIAGYLLALGRCKKCGRRISLAYPAFEAVYGLIALLVFNKYGINLLSASFFLLIGCAAAVAVIDFKTLTIPDSLLVAIIAFSVYPIILNNSILNNLYGFLLMSGFFIVVLLIFPGSFGGGDVKFAAVIGAVLGLESAIIALETALIAGSVVGVIYVIKTKKGFKSKIPFAPFLTAGLFTSIMYGNEILLLYYNMLY